MANAIEAVIFDMDGTLVDSERVAAKAWRVVADRMGVDLPDSVINSLIGRNEQSCRELVCAQLKGDKELTGKAFRAHVDMFDELCADELELKPGARESIDTLRASGRRVGLATSTSRARAIARLERFGLEDAFAAVVCGDQVERSKPAPDIFLAAAERLGVTPERCAVVEDSLNGVRAGHAAGMHVFMVPDLVAPTAEIEALCDAVLPSLDELVPTVSAVR